MLRSRQGPSTSTLLHKQFTFLTLPGVWGTSTWRLTSVGRGLPYIISASIWRLFFRCCTRDLHLQTQAEEQRRAGCAEPRSACSPLAARGRAGFCQRAVPYGQPVARPSSRYFNRFTGIQSQAGTKEGDRHTQTLIAMDASPAVEEQ